MNYLEDYLNIKFKAPTYAAGTFMIFSEGNNIAVCPNKVGMPKYPDYINSGDPNHVALFDVASAYIFPGLSFPNWINTDPHWPGFGEIRLDKLVQATNISGQTYQKVLMADKTYRLSTQGVMNNHSNGGNFLYADGHVTWWQYNICLIGTNSYSTQGAAMLPPYHIWPDRAEGAAPAGISSISTGASGTAVWIGRPSAGSYYQ